MFRWEEAAVWPASSPWPKDYDLGHIWKAQGEAAERRAGGYYINAAQAGEPPGRWWGPGAQALGLTPGQIVQRASYEAIYQQIDPRTGAKLGRPRGRYPTFADHLARLRAAEPHASAERLVELERQAAQATRQPAAYTDVNVSFSQVHLGAACLDPGEQAPRPPGRGPAVRCVLGRARAGVPGDLAPGQPGRSGVPAGVGRGYSHRLPRHQGRWP